ncbi:glycosyltransferase family A protein [Trinickia sp. YCB016]
MEMQNEKPTVAVIVPFYNGSRWVERAIASIYEQTVPANEVIVVNDGSRSEEQAALYALNKKYPFRIIDKPNGGQGSARNAGVDASNSDYICFLDQDDYYLPEHIEILVCAIPKREARLGFIYGDCMEADGDGNIVRSSMVKEHSKHPKQAIVDLLRNDMFILPSASIICRKAYSAVGGFDEQFTGYEDDDFFMRMFRKGYTHRFVDEPVYVWRIHPESTSYSIRMSRSRFLYFRKLVDAFPDDPSRGRYYFRDCLVPRFGQAFLVDAVTAAMRKSPDKAELVGILSHYTKILRVNPYVRRRMKIKLTMTTFVLSSMPSWALKAMRYAAVVPAIRRRLAT